MRRIVGGVLLVAALAAVAAGAALMIVLGPDNRALSGPHPVETSGVAVVTKPSAISWAGPTVSVLAEVPGKKPVFVGLGNAVDVDNYLGKTARLRIDTVKIPWRITTTSIKGAGNVPAAPTALDWWLAGNAGLGGAAITTPLPDEPVSLAVVPVGDSNLDGLTITTAYDVGGGFGMGAGALAIGLGLGAIGVPLVRGLPLTRGASDDAQDEDWEDDDWEDDEAIYVYVDANGEEHEVPAEELENYEIVDEEDVVDDPEPVPARAPVPAAIANVTTAGGIAAQEPIGAVPEEEVVYVYVDEDGVEREIGADEAQEYEIIEESVEHVEEPAAPGAQPRRRVPWGRRGR